MNEFNNTTVPVQSCITTISFPKCWEDFETMLEKHGKPMTDMDHLLRWEKGEEGGWTAASWMRSGDVLFFYHAVKAKKYTAARLREAKKLLKANDPVIEVLKRACETAARFGGTIFGCSEVISEIKYSQEDHGHFHSRCFAPFANFNLFANPLASQLFKDHVKISQNTVTSLDGRQFMGIKQLLAAINPLPSFLQIAEATTKAFFAINSRNWKSISCAPEVRFRDESQLREYFLDYLLNDLKDAGSPLLLECECYRDGTSTGFADYMVKMNGRWVPVEAKLHLGTAPNVLSQATKYQNIQMFSPRLGNHRGTQFKTDANLGCLLADQIGIYAVRGDQFFRSSPSQPIIHRQNLETTDFEALISTIKSLFENPITGTPH